MNLQPDRVAPMDSARLPVDQVTDPEVTSEFDDDPVDMAVRVGLGEAGGERQPQHARAPAPQTLPPSFPDQRRPSAGHRVPSGATGQYSAYDLLQGIIEAQPGQAPQPQRSMPVVASAPTAQYNYGSSGSIWTMSREESEKGKQRGSVSQAPLAHVAGLWDTPEAAKRSGSNSPSRLPSAYQNPHYHAPGYSQSWAAHQMPQQDAPSTQPAPTPYWMALDNVPMPRTQPAPTGPLGPQLRPSHGQSERPP